MPKSWWKINLIWFTGLIYSCQNHVQQPSYAEHIAPIILRSCAPCHRPGQIGHFSLLTYDDVKLNAKKIAYTVHNRIMPPWPADPDYTQFVGQNVLSEEEINLIELWVEQGCVSGNLANTPPLPDFPVGSRMGVPDLKIPVKPLKISGDYADRFLVVKVPFEIPQDTFVSMIEFVPGNPKVVHHVNGDLVRFEYEKKNNVFDGTWVDNLVWDSTIRQVYKSIGVLHDDGSFPTLARSVMNYLPGVSPARYPEGIGGWRVNRKSAFLLADIHYGPSTKDLWDSSYINLFFSRSHPRRPVNEVQLGTLGASPIVPPLIIPPGKISRYKSSLFIPEDISVLTINPHMHLLGRNFLAYALTPTHDTIRLIRIPRWDFNWQYFYTFKKMLRIPARSVIVMEGEFDNTDQNPFNPFHPPREVSDHAGSMRTTDEMFQLIITYLPYETGDENISLEQEATQPNRK